MSMHGIRRPGQCLLYGIVGFGKVPLLKVQGTQGQMKSGVILKKGQFVFQKLFSFFNLFGSFGRLRQKDVSLYIAAVFSSTLSKLSAAERDAPVRKFASARSRRAGVKFGSRSTDF